MTISATNLVKKYGKKFVVDDVDFQVSRGEIVGLLGPNGAGKTTCFYMIVGLIRANGGKVFLDDKEITAFPMHKRAQMGIGYLAQEASVFRKMTVEENILAILEVVKCPRNEQKARLEELLQEFRIEHVRRQRASSLSGGERRRVEIARALATNPSFILLDEPFAGVDPIAVSDIQDIIAHLKSKGLGVLITDHSVREMLSIIDRAYIMHEGKILIAGTSEEISSSEIARKFYLGERFSM